MTFTDIIDKAAARAAQLGYPLVFGDTAVQNVAANEIGTDFFTLDIAGSSYLDTKFANAPRGYICVVRCMGVSGYLRDDATEIETLKRTDLLLNQFMNTFICGFAVSGVRIAKLQNEYDTIKSGWQITFEVQQF